MTENQTCSNTARAIVRASEQRENAFAVRMRHSHAGRQLIKSIRQRSSDVRCDERRVDAILLQRVRDHAGIEVLAKRARAKSFGQRKHIIRLSPRPPRVARLCNSM